ncbi:tautomerase family protein [Erwinia aphidicola]
MPLLQFDVIQGRSESELKTLLDAAHRAVLTAFNVPARDRYQIVHENKGYQMVFEDTGLDLPRTDNLVMVRVFTSPRSERAEAALYGRTVPRTGRELWDPAD